MSCICPIYLSSGVSHLSHSQGPGNQIFTEGERERVGGGERERGGGREREKERERDGNRAEISAKISSEREGNR